MMSAFLPLMHLLRQGHHKHELSLILTFWDLHQIILVESTGRMMEVHFPVVIEDEVSPAATI